MAAMITNHFKLRRDVLTYNLSGMGCSSSLICIDLVKHLLKVRRPVSQCTRSFIDISDIMPGIGLLSVFEAVSWTMLQAVPCEAVNCRACCQGHVKGGIEIGRQTWG